MGNLIDIAGQKFGKWTAIKRALTKEEFLAWIEQIYNRSLAMAGSLVKTTILMCLQSNKHSTSSLNEYQPRPK